MEKSILVNGWTSSGMADKCEVRLQTRSVIQWCRCKPEWTWSKLRISELPTCIMIRCWTGNWCSWCSNSLAWDHVDGWSTIQAALFRNCCGYLMVLVSSPWSAAVQ